MPKIYFHVDVNSAFLSWSALKALQGGSTVDLRTIPAVVGGDEAKRHGVVLAKSTPAKKFGIQTGESLFAARVKCPGLTVVPPDFDFYVKNSKALIQILNDYTPDVEQYSIDEAFLDMTGTEALFGPPLTAAHTIRRRVRRELGFTVNIGISCNKLLAKMAGDFEKPDKVHTLFPDELEAKLWPLPTQELFMLGAATARKLRRFGIDTIGALANADPVFLTKALGKQGQMLWQYANGRGEAFLQAQPAANKGYGNAVTTSRDVTDRAYACQVLLSLCETVGMRLRRDGQAGSCVTIQLRTSEFETWSHQMRLASATNVTGELYQAACSLLDQAWDRKTPLRQLGVSVTQLADGTLRQYSLFDAADYARQEKLDTAVDALREKFGEGALFRAALLHSDERMAGGLHKKRRTGITKPIEDEAARIRKKYGNDD